MPIRCPSCHAENRDGSKFCSACAAPLGKAYEGYNPILPYISCTPRWDPLRSEPRFQALLHRMGIPVKDN